MENDFFDECFEIYDYLKKKNDTSKYCKVIYEPEIIRDIISMLKVVPESLFKKNTNYSNDDQFEKFVKIVQQNSKSENNVEDKNNVEKKILINRENFKMYLDKNNSFDKLIMSENESNFEVLISNLKLGDIENELEITDRSTGIKYFLGKPSENYIKNLLRKLLIQLREDKKYEEMKSIIDYIEIDKEIIVEINDKIDGEHIYDYFYEKILNILVTPVSLRIRTTKKIGLEKLKEIINSFSFEYVYSKNKEIILSEDIYEAFKIKNETKNDEIISFHEKNIDTPLKYNSKLINFYRTGIKAEDPYIQYLSYYHILEYHYYRNLKNKVANELREKLEDIQNNKVEDVASNIIKTVNKGTQERTVLKSILEENITDNIQNLRDRIIEINDNVSYRTSINFSNASSINWNESVSNIIDQITNRIYDTRNSLVHSKEDEIEKIYEPWNDEHVKELKKEIPLIRALAELIIKNTGENINLD